jgi:Protein of unknown function with HXXEE motif
MPQGTRQPVPAAKKMLDRLCANWVYGGSLAGLLLLLISPLLADCGSVVLFLTFLHLPVYMLHQYEEHDDDRFRRFVNRTLGKGRELLSRADVFVINVPGVWGVIAISFCLASQVDLGFALIAVYLVLVNAIVHIAHAVVFRTYNPGLGTAIFLFLPFSVYSLWQVQTSGAGTLPFHALGLFVAVGLHAAIVIYCKFKPLIVVKLR